MWPLFSVIIPCFNRANLVGVAIESVLNQEFIDCELIVTDDGSTDNTSQGLRGYGNRILLLTWVVFMLA